MASTAKSSTKWGSFFEKAVAGLESRLDTVLGEEDDTQPSATQSNGTKPESERLVPAYSMEAHKSLDSNPQATNKRPDRLQQRLAKAVGRNPPLSGSGTPSVASTSPRTSLDKDAIGDDSAVGKSSPSGTPTSNNFPTHDVIESDGPAIVIHEGAEDVETTKRKAPTTQDDQTLMQNGMSPSRQSAESDASEIHKQQEIHGYLEQIESLRAKLQFLTQQAAADAQERAKSADKGSMEKHLAEKDEKIALLMEEGVKLSQNEMRLMTTVKTLRNKSVEEQKQMAKVKSAEEQNAKLVRTLQDKVRAAETSSKDDSKQKAIVESTRKELEQVRAQLKTKDTEINDLQKQVLQNAIASQETEKFRKELDAERRISSGLKEDVSDAKLERSLLEDRHKAQIRDLEFKHDRVIQDSKATELDLKHEVQVLESRLESLRTRAEEVSSDGKGDAQAKLVRQIETLQSSYSVASENWRGIESSLMARIAAYEKEQAEAQKKEAELRRKVRELSSKLKDIDLQLETSRSQVQELEEDLNRATENHKQTSAILANTKAELEEAQADLKSTKETMETRLEKLESEKRDAVQESLAMRSRAQSPAVKTSFEPSLSSSRRYPQSPGVSFPGGLGIEKRPHSRRASVQPSPGFMPRQDSGLSIAYSGSRDSIPPTPAINLDEDDDFFDDMATPATPPERTIHDMVSTSTAGAGPSVQLVERMSAAVRRLESEKQASKDELERLSGQRDEARNQVVGLMQELEEKKKVEQKTAELEKEIQELNNKLQTTLEMLGEKSELVEELRADISDMKEIYKATLESTVK